MRMWPFAKRFIAVSLCAGLVLSGTGGTTASQVNIDNISTEGETLDSETSNETTVQTNTETQTSDDAQGSTVSADSGTDTDAGAIRADSGTDTDAGTISADSGTDAGVIDAGVTDADSNADADADDADTQGTLDAQEKLTEGGTKSEENTGREGDTDPEKNRRILDYTDGNVYITVRAEEGVIPENVSLHVDPIMKDGNTAESTNEDASANVDEAKNETTESVNADASKGEATEASESASKAAETTEADETATQTENGSASEKADTQADTMSSSEAAKDAGAAANSKTYEEVAAELEKDAAENDYELLGFLAYDISFVDENENEVEPDGDVTVTMKYKNAVLPEGVDGDSTENAEVSIMHLNETGSKINVENLSDTANIQTDSQQAVLSTVFTSDSFSTFTITWKSTYTIVLHYVDESGNEFTGTDTITYDSLTGSDNSDKLYFANYAYPEQIDKTKYLYMYAKNGGSKSSGSTTYSSTASEVRYAYRNSGLKFAYYNASTGKFVDVSPTSISNAYHVYLVYQEKNIKTEDTSDNVTINLFDYIANSSINNEDSGPNDQDKLLTGINGGHSLKFTNKQGHTYTAVNDWTGDYAVQGIVQSKLGSDGYPVLNTWAGTDKSGNYESLNYLFDPEISVTDSDDNPVKKSYAGLTNLFIEEDDGYYSYKSSSNFATIAGNEENNKSFTVYNTEEGGRQGFFPFTSYANATYKSANTYDEGGDEFDSSMVDHYFGMSVVSDFVQPAGGTITSSDGTKKEMQFNFSGDDDVWVYIDDVLVLDIGGRHGAISSYINFATGEVYISNAKQINTQTGLFDTGTVAGSLKTDLYTLFASVLNETELNKYFVTIKNEDGTVTRRFTDNSLHTIKFFYLERGNDDSNCDIYFNLKTVPKGSLIASKTVSGEVEDPSAQYEFTLTGEDVSNREYTLYSSTGSSSTGHTDNDGKFYLKNGEYAVFSDFKDGEEYTVTETDYEEFYTYVTYYSDSGDLESKMKNSATVKIDSNKAASVNFLNVVKPEGASDLTYSKYVKKNGTDDTYDLTLTVSGAVGNRVNSNVEAFDADVVFVTGNSEDEQKIVDALALQLAGLKPLVETRFSVVSLKGGGKVKQSGNDWISGSTILANYKTAANNSNLIAVGTSSTSVDYENALETAKSLLTEKNTDGSTSNTKKVVILINNASTALDSNGLSSAGAVLADMNEDLDFFFAVNTDGENTDTNLDELIKAYAPASAVTGVFAYSDAAISDTTGTATTVEDKIVSLVSNKLTGIYTSNVSITDILSDYAEWVDGSDIEIKITDSDNEPVAVTKVSTEDDGSETDVIQSQSWKLGQCTITAKLVKVVENNVTKREIKLEFPKEYQLPTGYTFSVTVQIEPTAAAYQYFDETHTTYPNIGDPGTDDSTVTVKTSSEKAGFSSNEEATVTYKNGDADPDTKKYAMPVIQISKAYSWQLFKVSASQFSLDQYVPLSSAEFELTSDSGTQTYYGMSLSSGEVHWYLTHKLNADDEVTCLEPGTYTLTEKKAPTGYLLSNQEWKVTVDGQNHLTVENADSISNIATEEKTTYATDSSPEIVKYNIYYKDEIFYELPSAGGTGIFLYLIAGMLLMMGGALLIFAKRRKVLRI